MDLYCLFSRDLGDEDGIHSAEETLLQLETASEAPSSPCHSLLRRRRSMDHIDIMSRSTTDSEAPLLSTSQGHFTLQYD